jgi:hypothetical protein
MKGEWRLSTAGVEAVTRLKLQSNEECSMKILQRLILASAAALLAGCASTDMHALGETAVVSDPGVAALTGTKKYTLMLKVENENGVDTLVVKNPKSSGCNKFADTDQFRKGCIVAGLNETAEIKVQFIGSNGWYFSEFQICRTADVNPQKPVNFDDCVLADDERADWLIIANSGIAIPGTDGRVDISQFGSSIRQFELRDLNWKEANYFYRIRACSSPTTCLWTDPGGQNNGRGWLSGSF